MSILFKPMGYLVALAATAGVAGCGSEVNVQGGDVTAAATGDQHVPLPRVPLKIPMPLDKAGYKVDVTFEVPPLPVDRRFWSGFIGLRILFAPGTSDVRIALEENPVAVRISLHRIEFETETPIPLFSSTKRPPPGTAPFRGDEVFELPDGVAIAVGSYTQLSGAPRGTPNASTRVLSFASAGHAITAGVYRLQVETLEDIPALSGVTSFLVYEKHPRG